MESQEKNRVRKVFDILLLPLVVGLFAAFCEYLISTNQISIEYYNAALVGLIFLFATLVLQLASERKNEKENDKFYINKSENLFI